MGRQIDKTYYKNNLIAQIFWKAWENDLSFKMQLLENQISLTDRPELLNTFTNAAALDLLRKQTVLLKTFEKDL